MFYAGSQLKDWIEIDVGEKRDDRQGSVRGLR